ncbi:hypothetical protein VPH35_136848 [Triticum aestivum]
MARTCPLATRSTGSRRSPASGFPNVGAPTLEEVRLSADATVPTSIPATIGDYLAALCRVPRQKAGRLPVERPTHLGAAQLPHLAFAGLSLGWTLFPATQPWSGHRAREEC